VEPGAVTGVWIATGPRGQQATLDLRPDGTYSGRGVPDRVFYSTFDDKYGGPADWEHPEEINGTWKMGWNETIKEASVVVDIIGRISGTEFDIDQGEAEPGLKYFIGDPGTSDYIEFERPN
jgi:hypothetical protein